MLQELFQWKLLTTALAADNPGVLPLPERTLNLELSNALAVLAPDIGSKPVTVDRAATLRAVDLVRAFHDRLTSIHGVPPNEHGVPPNEVRISRRLELTPTRTYVRLVLRGKWRPSELWAPTGLSAACGLGAAGSVDTVSRFKAGMTNDTGARRSEVAQHRTLCEIGKEPPTDFVPHV